VFGRADPPAWAHVGDVPAERVAAAYFQHRAAKAAGEALALLGETVEDLAARLVMNPNDAEP